MKTTKHSQTIIAVNPIEKKEQLAKRAIIEKIKMLAKTRKLGDLNWKLLRDEGRR